MKRVWIVPACIFLVAVLLLLLFSGGGTDPAAPRFVAGAPASLPAFTWNHYDWVADLPFEGDKMWLWTASGTNHHVYLYDLRQRLILGELLNGWVPELAKRDNSKIMFQGQDAWSGSIKQKLVEVLRKLSGGKISPGNRTETFWVLDLRNNSAARIGTVSQFQGSGSRWHRSPGSRYGYTRPTTAMDKSLFLCDLDAGSGKNIPIRGEPKGWWSDREILMGTSNNEFELLDVETQKNRPLFSREYIIRFLADAGVENPSRPLDVMANWNGREYDFYFGEKDHIYGLSGTNSFLLKAERSGPALKFLYRDFKFQWGGHLDETATQYLYQGESGKPGNGGDGAVYVRNLANGTESTVVPPDNKGQYAIPRFYGGEVIYFRNRLMQRVRLDGSNDVPVITSGGK